MAYEEAGENRGGKAKWLAKKFMKRGWKSLARRKEDKTARREEAG